MHAFDSVVWAEALGAISTRIPSAHVSRFLESPRRTCLIRSSRLAPIIAFGFMPTPTVFNTSSSHDRGIRGSLFGAAWKARTSSIGQRVHPGRKSPSTNSDPPLACSASARPARPIGPSRSMSRFRLLIHPAETSPPIRAAPSDSTSLAERRNSPNNSDRATNAGRPVVVKRENGESTKRQPRHAPMKARLGAVSHAGLGPPAN